VYDCPAVLQQTVDKEGVAPESKVRVKFFNRDEENTRVLSSSMELQANKQCTIL